MADPSFPDDLPSLETALWNQIARGVSDRHSPLRWPVFSTVGPDGSPQARILALRGVDRQHRRLTFYSDARTAKVEAVRESRPSAAVLFFDPRRMIQIRAGGAVALHTEGPRKAAEWQKISGGRTSDYSAAPGPGTALDDPHAYDPEGADPETHFAVVDVQVQRLDALHLSRDGHRRARLDYDAAPASSWVVP